MSEVTISMAENDIYNSKSRYEIFKKNLDLFAIPPKKRQDSWKKKGKYYCKNKENLKYFKRLFFKGLLKIK